MGALGWGPGQGQAGCERWPRSCQMLMVGTPGASP